MAPSRASEPGTCGGHGGSRRRRPSSPTSDKGPWPPQPPCPRQPSSQRPLRPALTYGDAAGRRGSELRMRLGWKTGLAEERPEDAQHSEARMRKAASLGPRGPVDGAALGAERNLPQVLRQETLCLIGLGTLGSGSANARLDALQVALTLLSVFFTFNFIFPHHHLSSLCLLHRRPPDSFHVCWKGCRNLPLNLLV